MLTELDERKLANDIVSWEQDAFRLGLVLGEPFLIDEFLGFFDGRTLFLVATPLSPSGDVHRVLRQLMRVYGPMLVDITGHREIDWSMLSDFGMTERWHHAPDSDNQELIVDFRRSAAFARRVRQTAPRMRSLGIECFRRQPGCLSHSHLALLRDFADRLGEDIGELDAASFIAMPNFLAQSSYGITIDAVRNGTLIGFAQGHTRYLPRLAVFVFVTASGIDICPTSYIQPS
jgi:hypothetical protein